MTAASPGIVASAMENRFYATIEDYVRAVAAALATEYRTIVDRGLLLQLDAPDLALERHTLFADRPLREFLGWVELVVDSINSALEGVDPSMVRLHVCWGNYEGPHTHDVDFADIQPLLYEARVGAIVLSMANARHAHEHHCFERLPLPDHMSLVAGESSRPWKSRWREPSTRGWMGSPVKGGGPHVSESSSGTLEVVGH